MDNAVWNFSFHWKCAGFFLFLVLTLCSAGSTWKRRREKKKSEKTLCAVRRRCVSSSVVCVRAQQHSKQAQARRRSSKILLFSGKLIEHYIRARAHAFFFVFSFFVFSFCLLWWRRRGNSPTAGAGACALNSVLRVHICTSECYEFCVDFFARATNSRFFKQEFNRTDRENVCVDWRL